MRGRANTFDQCSSLIDNTGALTTASISEGRQLSDYADGGHSDCRQYSEDALKRPDLAKKKAAASLKSAREFILSHWQTKKRGYIRVSFNSVDATGTSHIFIEPDSGGHWEINWRIVRQHAFIKDNNVVSVVPTFRTVERLKSEDGYILVFKSDDGLQLKL
jgi:hypothetical protein